MKLEKMSDDELLALYNKEVKTKSLEDMSDDELTALYNEKPTANKAGMAEAALEGIGEGVSFGYLGNLQAATEPLTFAALNKITGQDVKPDDYVAARDSYNKRQEQIKEDQPNAFYGGQVGGALLTAAPFLKAGQAATKLGRVAQATGVGATQGVAQSPQDVEGEINPVQLSDRFTGLALGGLLGAGGQLASEGASAALPFISKGVQNTGSYIKRQAGKLAEKATGATGKQSEKFAEGAGNELLDRGLLKAFDDPEKIAQRAQTAMNESYSQIDDALSQLDASGAEASIENIVKVLENKVVELNKTAGNNKLIKQIQNEIDSLYERGQSGMPLSAGEVSKRNFQKQVNWNSSEAEKTGAYAVSDAFKDEVERAALATKPELAEQFTKAKQDYSLLAPIEKAAQKRADTLNQSPFGGLLDVAAIGAGGGFGGEEGTAAGLAFAGGRRFLAPRLASTLAVSLNKISKPLMAFPKLQASLQANPVAVATIANNLLKTPALEAMSQENPGAFGAIVDSIYEKSQSDQKVQEQQIIQNYSPYEREQYIRKDQTLKPSEKAKLLKENRTR
jgi:hypothetical protein